MNTSAVLHALAALAATATLASTTSLVQAQAFPTKPVRIIVPFPTGSSSNDIATRAIATPMGESMGQTIIVDNKPGAAGNIGAEMVVKSPADGYTLLAGANSTMAVSPAVYKLSFDVVKDLTPVGMVAKFPYVLVVPSTLPIRNVKELVAYARANPGKFNFASGSGTGSTTHLCPELLNASQGLTMAHIPYKGGAQAMIDLIAGQVQLFCGGITGTLSGMKSGKLRVIGIATTKRSEQLPDVATVIEQGIPDFEVASWLGVFAPAGTPQPVVRRLNEEINKAVARPDTRKLFAGQGAEVALMSPEETGSYHRTELARWGGVVKRLGIKAE